MERISYARPPGVDEALYLLNESEINNFVLAGGTDLMLMFRMDKKLCGRVVDISEISELHEIKLTENVVTFGAAATFNEILNNPIIKKTAPVLAQACQQVGAAQIRNMGTVGGNVANAAACADSIPALVCLNAIAKIKTPNGELEFPVSELVTGPNKTKIPKGGLIISFSYQVPLPGSRSIFFKLGRRNAMAISRLTVAALGRLDDSNTIVEARFVTGSATPQICRIKVVEDSLIGKRPGEELFKSSATLATDEMIRLSGKRWSSEFKIPALQSMTARAFSQIFITKITQQELS